MRVIYLDELFIVNLIVDYLALGATALISGKSARKIRVSIASCVGAMYASLSAIIPFLSVFPLVLVLAYVMIVIAFGSNRRNLNLLFIFLFSSSLFCGAIMAAERYFIPYTSLEKVKISLRSLLLVVSACYVLLRLFMNRQLSKAVFEKEIALKIVFGERSIHLTAARDTGNRLRDPLTGKGVIVINIEAAKPLFEPNLASVVGGVGKCSAADTLALLSTDQSRARFGLIPFNSIGEKGLMLTFRPDRIEEDGENSNSSLIAFSPNPIIFNENHSVNAIIN